MFIKRIHVSEDDSTDFVKDVCKCMLMGSECQVCKRENVKN